MVKFVLKFVLAGFFIVLGLSHFLRLGFDADVVFTALPWPLAALYLSGAFEILLGGLILYRSMQEIAAWGMVVLLVAMLPAHIAMAINAEWYDLGNTALWGRLPLQFVLIGWALWYTRPSGGRQRQHSTSRARTASALPSAAPALPAASPPAADTPALSDRAAVKAEAPAAPAESEVRTEPGPGQSRPRKRGGRRRGRGRGAGGGNKNVNPPERS